MKNRKNFCFDTKTHSGIMINSVGLCFTDPTYHFFLKLWHAGCLCFDFHYMIPKYHY
jgi:hypothetical protein